MSFCPFCGMQVGTSVKSEIKYQPAGYKPKVKGLSYRLWKSGGKVYLQIVHVRSSKELWKSNYPVNRATDFWMLADVVFGRTDWDVDESELDFAKIKRLYDEYQSHIDGDGSSYFGGGIRKVKDDAPITRKPAPTERPKRVHMIDYALRDAHRHLSEDGQTRYIYNTGRTANLHTKLPANVKWHIEVTAKEAIGYQDGKVLRRWTFGPDHKPIEVR